MPPAPQQRRWQARRDDAASGQVERTTTETKGGGSAASGQVKASNEEVVFTKDDERQWYFKEQEKDFKVGEMKELPLVECHFRTQSRYNKEDKEEFNGYRPLTVVLEDNTQESNRWQLWAGGKVAARDWSILRSNDIVTVLPVTHYTFNGKPAKGVTYLPYFDVNACMEGGTLSWSSTK